jgi:hypothetical protein
MGLPPLLPLRRKSCYCFESPLKIHRPRPGQMGSTIPTKRPRVTIFSWRHPVWCLHCWTLHLLGSQTVCPELGSGISSRLISVCGVEHYICWDVYQISHLPNHPNNYTYTDPTTHQNTYLPTHHSTYPPSYLPNHPTYPTTLLPSHLPTQLPTHLQTHLPTSFLTYLRIHLPTHSPTY